MKITDFLLLLGLMTFLFLGIWLLSFNGPTEQIKYESIDLNLSENKAIYSNSSQFYPRMRYKDNEITYWVDEGCDSSKKNSILGALVRLMDRTNLVFTKAQNQEDSEIYYLCSENNSPPKNSDYYVAGEGGPVKIINTTNYFVILRGEVSLYKDETCPEAQVALHETLHALGFDHNNNQSSILYPITNCNQIFDSYLINEINGLYSQPSYPDVIIESLNASRKGKYLSFNIAVSNVGLEDANEVVLSILSGEEKVRKFELEDVDIGIRRKLSVQNLKLPSESKNLIFEVKLVNQAELNTQNNKVSITAV